MTEKRHDYGEFSIENKSIANEGTFLSLKTRINAGDDITNEHF